MAFRYEETNQVADWEDRVQDAWEKKGDISNLSRDELRAALVQLVRQGRIDVELHFMEDGINVAFDRDPMWMSECVTVERDARVEAVEAFIGDVLITVLEDELDGTPTPTWTCR